MGGGAHPSALPACHHWSPRSQRSFPASRASASSAPRTSRDHTRPSGPPSSPCRIATSTSRRGPRSCHAERGEPGASTTSASSRSHAACWGSVRHDDSSLRAGRVPARVRARDEQGSEGVPESVRSALGRRSLTQRAPRRESRGGGRRPDTLWLRRQPEERDRHDDHHRDQGHHQRVFDRGCAVLGAQARKRSFDEPHPPHAPSRTQDPRTGSRAPPAILWWRILVARSRHRLRGRRRWSQPTGGLLRPTGCGRISSRRRRRSRRDARGSRCASA